MGIEIAKAGLNRFYEEGYTRWPLDKLRTIFQKNDLESPEIAAALKEWEKSGWVQLPKTDEEYLVLLQLIPQ